MSLFAGSAARGVRLFTDTADSWYPLLYPLPGRYVEYFV